MKKGIALLLTIVMALTLTSWSLAEEPADGTFKLMNLYDQVPQSIEEAEPTGRYYLPEQIKTDAYFYIPAKVNTADITYAAIAPVFILYADYANQDEAYAAFKDCGLKALADEQGAYSVVLTRVGEDWGKDDLALFDAAMLYIISDNYGETGNVFSMYAYNARTFVFAQGDAATFVNHYIAGSSYQLSGVVSIGGEVGFESKTALAEGSRAVVSIDPVSTEFPLVAYLGKPGEGVLEHYKTINHADSEKTVGDNTVYYSANDPIFQVVSSGAEKIDANVIADFWELIGKKTTRLALTYKVFVNHYNTDPFYYCDLPDYEDLGVVRVDHTEGVLEGTVALQEWYEFVPEEVANNTFGDKKYSLIIVCHGAGDKPVYEAESQGWVGLIADNDVIVASMEHATNTDAATRGNDINTLTRHIIGKYPVDATRVYIVGFSMGGGVVSNAVQDDPNLYAAFGILHSGFSGDFSAFENLKLAGHVTMGGHDPYVFSDRNKVTLDTITKQAGYTIEYGEDASSENFYGLGIEDATNVPSYGMNYLYKEFPGPDGIPYLAVSCLENADHVHFSGNAKIMWQFMSRFSRDVNGELIYTPNK